MKFINVANSVKTAALCIHLAVEHAVVEICGAVVLYSKAGCSQFCDSVLYLTNIKYENSIYITLEE